VVVEYIRYTIDDARTQAFEQAYRRSGEALDASPHCERYEVSRCTEDATRYVVRIEWDSEEGHMTGCRQSPEFRASSRRSAPSSTTSRRCVITGSPSRAKHESRASAGFGLRFLDRHDAAMSS
jgi:heme-degrading monooxygenase HmoA